MQYYGETKRLTWQKFFEANKNGIWLLRERFLLPASRQRSDAPPVTRRDFINDQGGFFNYFFPKDQLFVWSVRIRCEGTFSGIERRQLGCRRLFGVCVGTLIKSYYWRQYAGAPGMAKNFNELTDGTFENVRGK